MTFPSFPLPAVAVEKKMTPLVASVSEPLMVQYWMVLFSAVLINSIVEVPAVARMLVLDMVRSVKPDWLTLPSKVTLSAPFKLIRGAAKFPVIV